jgi:outer membrane receptor protein involved in Fe transport
VTNRSPTLFAGARWDHNSIYGSEISPRVSRVRHLPGSQSIRLSYGTAFDAPTDIDEYLDQTTPVAPGLSTPVIGNTKLVPEKIVSTELGYRRDLVGGYIAASLFQNFVSDQIVREAVQFAPSPFPARIPTTIEYENGGNARATGFELEGGFTIARNLHGLLNYSYQDVVNTTTHNPVDLSRDDKINLVLNEAWGSRWTAYTAVHYVSASTYYVNPESASVPAYTTVDAKLGYRVGSAKRPLTLAISATNVFDDNHREFPVAADLPGLPQASAVIGRTSWMSLSGGF